MNEIIAALDTLGEYRWAKEFHDPAWKTFVLEGDERVLAALPTFAPDASHVHEILRILPVPEAMDEGSRRLLRALIVTGHPNLLGYWLQTSFGLGTALGARFDAGVALLTTLGASRPMIAGQIIDRTANLCDDMGVPNAAGRFVLSLTPAEMDEVLHDPSTHAERVEHIALLFVRNVPERWKALLDSLTANGRGPMSVATMLMSLAGAPALFLESAARMFDELGEVVKPDTSGTPYEQARARSDDWGARYDLGVALAKAAPERYAGEMQRIASDVLRAEATDDAGQIWKRERAALWLANNSGVPSLELLVGYIAAPATRADRYNNAKEKTLDAAVRSMGRAAIPLLDAAFVTEKPYLQMSAVRHWVSFGDPPDAGMIADRMRHLLGSADSAVVARAVCLASELRIETVEESLWPLLTHKSKPVRDDVAAGLAALGGDARIPKAAALWASKKADIRLATVAWLSALGSTSSAETLAARLEIEETDAVRDAIMVALEKIGGPAAATDDAARKARIAKTLAKLDGPPVPWLDPKRLPAARLTDGSKLSADLLLYLLYRQSRVKEMRADIEARATLALIDRDSSGDLALAVLRAFLDAGASADDRWAMAFAALLGDDRIVPILARQVKSWADASRGKLAEYAVQALALLGSDVALVALDAMAIRYASKNTNIGQAASDAIALAAESRGISVQEFGDVVVPWLDFEPGQPRVIESAKGQIEVRIGSDFKLAYRDMATNKPLTKLPSGITAPVKAEQKELAGSLKESVKAQLLRLETLSVRQFRWPSARWEALYLQHPLLLPFVQRLVWGAYDANGALVSTFRALDDRSLTNAEDEPYSMPRDVTIGIIHPLELSPELRQRWLAHLADYDVVPPFAQMERPVIVVTDAQKTTTLGSEVDGTRLNGMTFKGRAERLGWLRGSVVDSGMIGHYRKEFPSAGVDAFLALEGMFVGMPVEEEIVLGKVFFVHRASAKSGAYMYDEPTSAADARLIQYGDVPAVAFSEAMGDLARISGRVQSESADTVSG